MLSDRCVCAMACWTPAAVVQSKRGMAASGACWGSPACLDRHELPLLKAPRFLVPYTTLAASFGLACGLFA